MNKVSIIATTSVGWNTAEPVYSKMKDYATEIHVFAPLPIKEKIDLTPNNTCNIVFHDINTLLQQHKTIRLLHRLLSIALTPLDFSENYKIILSKKLKRLGALSKLVLFLKKVGPKTRGDKVNSIICKLLGPFTPNVFPSKNLLIITQFDSPFAALLTNKDQFRVTLIESWDHAAKFPMGYTSDTVFLWNNRLKENWLEYQGDLKRRTCFPYKLGYAINHKRTGEPLDTPRYWMYAATFSEHSNQFFIEELLFLEQICKAAKSQNRYIYIKPKPNSDAIHFEHLKNQFTNITIGKGQNSKTPNSYFLDEEYNKTRIQELEETKLVINIGTTFALDAAAFGIPVFQFILLDKEKYPNIYKIRNYPHLKEHIYSNTEYLYKITGVPEEDSNALGDLTAEEFTVSNKFSTYLRQWLGTEKPETTSNQEIVDCLMSAKEKTH